MKMLNKITIVNCSELEIMITENVVDKNYRNYFLNIDKANLIISPLNYGIASFCINNLVNLNVANKI